MKYLKDTSLMTNKYFFAHEYEYLWLLTAYPVAEWLRRAFSTPPLLLMFGGSNPACTTKHLGFIYLKKCLLLSSQYWKEMKIQASGWKFPLEAIKTQLQAPRGKFLWEFRYRLPDEAELIGRWKLLVTRMLLVVFVKWLKYHKVPWEIGLLKMPWPRNHCPKGMRCLSKKAWV